MSQHTRCSTVMAHLVFIVVAIVGYVCGASGQSEQEPCTEVAYTEGGAVCGQRRVASDGSVYASFRNVPYAKQPLGALRFKELEPVEPWQHLLDASNDGPICPQYDYFYGPIAYPQRNMSEACIHANIHVPITALPVHRDALGPRSDNDTGLPILVFIHGGSFAFGSGDADVHGPQFLVTKDIIIITFNYRLNVFGFLSLNSSSIPGNAGMRDQVTLLRWVQRNARAFGGDPSDVTIVGQSAGAVCAHFLTLSPSTKGLFNKAIIMSGTALQTVFTASPIYARTVANALLTGLGINSTDPEEIHNQLIEMPLENIMQVNKALLDQFGVAAFVPVIESPVPNTTIIVDDDPENLLKMGRGRDYPLIIGYTSNECETFRHRFEEVDVLGQLNETNTIGPPKILFTESSEESLRISKDISDRYFHGEPTMDEYIKYCTEAYFQYAAIRLAQFRADQDDTLTYLYQFSYENDSNIIKVANNFKYKGAGHVEDMTYIFRNNAVFEEPKLNSPDEFDPMREWMTDSVVNFMRCRNQTCNSNYWRPVNNEAFNYQDILTPGILQSAPLTSEQEDMLKFYDQVYYRNV